MRSFSSSLIISYLLIVFGVYLMASSGYDEWRGITHKPYVLAGRRHHQAYLYRIAVDREQNPELFRQFMTLHWIWAVGIEGVGWVLFVRNK
jgi:hypothetical protein